MIFSRISKQVFLSLIFFLMLGCEQEVTPCNCSKNLIKSEKSYDSDLDKRCDLYLESLNEKEAQKWTDSMMNCASESK